MKREISIQRALLYVVTFEWKGTDDQRREAFEEVLPSHYLLSLVLTSDRPPYRSRKSPSALQLDPLPCRKLTNRYTVRFPTRQEVNEKGSISSN